MSGVLSLWIVINDPARARRAYVGRAARAVLKVLRDATGEWVYFPALLAVLPRDIAFMEVVEGLAEMGVRIEPQDETYFYWRLP